VSGPQCPEALVYLWHWFLEIMGGCASGFGPTAITWRDLEAWTFLTGIRLEPWEVAAILRLSNTYQRVRSAEMKPKKGGA
jgi:hypothetical protein